MSRPRILAVGELLWDLFPDGRQLGGAPGNVAHHALSLGADVVLLSRVGRDALGDDAVARLREAGIPPTALQRDPTAPTGTAAVQVDRDGQPRFHLAEDVAWDRIAPPDSVRADAVYFGTLAQRAPGSRRTIRRLLAAGALNVLDLNLRDPHGSDEVIRTSLGLADVVKVSEDELDRCSRLLELGGDRRDRIAELARRFRLRLVALTRGSRGSLLYGGGRWSEHPGLEVPVTDAVGAGDAFTAALLLGLLRGESLDAISRQANQVAAFVCTQRGATPRLPVELRGKVLEENP